MPNDRNPVKHQLKIFGPAALMVIVAFVLAFQFIKPAPPDRVVMATGGVDGAYHAFATRYAEFLAREGITLELRPTAGTVENLALLRSGEVSLAMVQGGVDDGHPASQLLSLGSLYYEPLWLFYRKDVAFEQLIEWNTCNLGLMPLRQSGQGAVDCQRIGKHRTIGQGIQSFCQKHRLTPRHQVKRCDLPETRGLRRRCPRPACRFCRKRQNLGCRPSQLSNTGNHQSSPRVCNSSAKGAP